MLSAPRQPPVEGRLIAQDRDDPEPRGWPALLLPGIIVQASVVGLMLPRRTAQVVVFSIIEIEVFCGWGGLALAALAGPLVFALALG